MFYDRNVDYVFEVLLPLGQKLGIDVSQGILSELAKAYITFINIAVKKLHDRFDFPCFILLEQRTPDANHYVPWEQVGLKIIHRTLKVYQRDPRVTFPPPEVPFHLDSTGVHVGYDHGTNVWLKYLQPAPFYAYDLWSNTVSYPKNSPIAFATSTLIAEGKAVVNTYRGLQDANLNHTPDVSPTWWELVPFHESVADLTVRLAFAEALREDGQFDKANSEEQAVIQEAISKLSAMVHPPFDTVTDQARAPSRYRPPAFNVPFSSGK
jgi:hypothetical protein